jgi:TolB-like protein
MKKLPYLLAVIFGWASLGFAQATTMPDPPPQPQLKVLVIPFAQIGPTTDHLWVGEALNENLMTQVAGNPAIQAINLNAPLKGAHDAISAARQENVAVVVFGSYQFSDSQLRIQGQVYDVLRDRTLTTLSATGAVSDLFKMEDTIASQLGSALPQPASQVPTVTYGADQSATPSYTTTDTANANPVQTYVYPAQAQPTYVYPSQPYVYANPYPYYGYGYGYPYYWGGPVFIYGGYGRGFYGGGYYRGGFRGGFYGGGHFGGGGRGR